MTLNSMLRFNLFFSQRGGDQVQGTRYPSVVEENVSCTKMLSSDRFLLILLLSVSSDGAQAQPTRTKGDSLNDVLSLNLLYNRFATDFLASI